MVVRGVCRHFLHEFFFVAALAVNGQSGTIDAQAIYIASLLSDILILLSKMFACTLRCRRTVSVTGRTAVTPSGQVRGISKSDARHRTLALPGEVAGWGTAVNGRTGSRTEFQAIAACACVDLKACARLAGSIGCSACAARSIQRPSAH